jgi:uncharacterized protein (DUF1501 family)
VKLLNRKAKLSAHSELVAEACRLALEIRRRETRPKLTAAGFVAAAVKAARSSAEKVAALRQQLEANAAGFPRAGAFVRQLALLYREPTTSRPAADPSNPALTQAGRDEAQAELATVSSTAMEAAAVAALLAAEDRHATFGQLESWETHTQELSEMRERLQNLYGRIEREVTGDDVGMEDTGILSYREAGLFRVTFKVSGGAVPLGPNAGERLTTFLLGQPEALRQLGVEV